MSSAILQRFFFPASSGKYNIFVNDNLVGSYNDTGSFGELALMYNMPRAATIQVRNLFIYRPKSSLH